MALMNPRLVVQQKITAFANKYAIFAAAPDTDKGQLVAFAQQKRLSFKEKVNFYSDDSKSQIAFSFRAEKVLDVHGRYLVEDTGGHMIGGFKKEFAKSLINSTWLVLDSSGQPKFQITESNQALAIFRRFGGFIPIVGELVDVLMLLLRYHFVITTIQTQEIVGKYQKTKLLRDHYQLSMTGTAYNKTDWRVLAAVAVALDALQSR